MGRISTDQSHQLMATLATNVDWSTVDFDGLQDLIVRRPKETGAAFGAWLKNRCQLTIKGPSALVVDRSKPFDPVKFIGSGWSIVEEDTRSHALTEIDFSKVRFESGLNDGESVIDGAEKLKRLLKMPEIRLDAKSGQALYEEKGQATLRFIYDHFNVSWFELAGTVLRDSDGDRYFLCLFRLGDGSWDWSYRWLGRVRFRVHVSPLLAS
jgi:hypothetical protein